MQEPQSFGRNEELKTRKLKAYNMVESKQQSLKNQINPISTVNAGQSEMFDLAEVQNTTKAMLKAYDAKPGEFSGAIIERNKEKVDLMLELLAQPDMTHKKIAKLCGVSRNTVAALERRAEDDGRLEAYTQRLLVKTRYAHRVAIDGLIESLERGDLPARDKGIVYGILSDHLGKLEGRPTHIVETRQEMGADEFKDWMEKVKMEVQEKEANVIDVEQDAD